MCTIQEKNSEVAQFLISCKTNQELTLPWILISDRIQIDVTYILSYYNDNINIPRLRYPQLEQVKTQQGF